MNIQMYRNTLQYMKTRPQTRLSYVHIDIEVYQLQSTAFTRQKGIKIVVRGGEWESNICLHRISWCKPAKYHQLLLPFIGPTHPLVGTVLEMFSVKK
jgi:hypothetical protein